MRVAVIGAGGVGGYFGGRLAASGVDTSFLVRGRTLEAIREQGLIVESIHGDFTIRDAKATDDPAKVGTVDVVLLAVKAWQVEEVLGTITPLLHAQTAIVPLENGIEAPEQIARINGAQHAVGGMCVIISYIVAPGHIRHAGTDPAVSFGELDNRPGERLQKLREAFTAAGVKADIPDDIHRALWSKFLFIAPLSAVGSITRATTGAWRVIPETRAMAISALSEVAALAHARGVTLLPDATDRALARYDALPPDSTSSMQRDVMEGRPSELEAQVGAAVRLGRALGVPTPTMDFLYATLLPQERLARAAR